jgi:hypothetical protein
MTRFCEARSCLVLSILITICVATSHAADERSIELLPRWKQGESHRLKLTKGREQSRAGKPTTRATGHSEVQLTVLEAGDDGYVLRWATVSIDKPLDPRVTADQAEALNHLAGKYVLEFEVDARATVKRLRNWDEVQRGIAEASELVMRNVPAPERDSVGKALGLVFESRDRAEPLLLKEPTLFLAAVGRAYTKGKPFEYDDLIPNPFGGDPFPAKGSFSLISLDQEDVAIAFRQTLDPEKTGVILLDAMKRMAERMGRPVPTTIPAGQDFEINDSADFIIDVATGWPRSMSHRREVKAQGQTRVDSLKIETIPVRP